MATLTGNLQDVIGTPFDAPGCAVLISSRMTRASGGGEAVILRLVHREDMEGSGGALDVSDIEPGPIRVELEGGSVTGEQWDVDLPEGTWSIADLLDLQTEWEPPVVQDAQRARDQSEAFMKRSESAAVRAETKVDDAIENGADLVREQVKSDADRAESQATIATNQADLSKQHREGSEQAQTTSTTQAQNSEKSAGQSQASATAAKTSEVNAKTSETNAAASESRTAVSEKNSKTSETNAADHESGAQSAATRSEKALESTESARDTTLGARDETLDAAGKVQGIVDTGVSTIRSEVQDLVDQSDSNVTASRAQADRATTEADRSRDAARAEVDKLKGDAPEAFDTLGEIADELKSNESERAVLTNQIAGKADKKHTHVSADISDAVSAIGSDAPANRVPLTDGNGEIQRKGTHAPSNSAALVNKFYVDKQVDGKADTGHTHTLSDISNAPNSHSTSPNANSLVSRSAGGFFFVNRPTNADHPTSKDYVDGEVAKKANASHTHTTSQISDLPNIGSGVSGGAIVQRKSNGQVGVHLTPQEDGDASSKRYVDRRPALFSGTGGPPSSITGAVPGDWWLDESTMEIYKIMGV